MSSSVTSSLPWLIECAPSSLNMCFYMSWDDEWWVGKLNKQHSVDWRPDQTGSNDLTCASGHLVQDPYETVLIYWLEVSTLIVWIWVCVTRALTWENSRFVLKPWLYIVPNDLYLLRCISYSQLKIFVLLLSAIALGIFYNLACVW